MNSCIKKLTRTAINTLAIFKGTEIKVLEVAATEVEARKKILERESACFPMLK